MKFRNIQNTDKPHLPSLIQTQIKVDMCVRSMFYYMYIDSTNNRNNKKSLSWYFTDVYIIKQNITCPLVDKNFNLLVQSSRYLTRSNIFHIFTWLIVATCRRMYEDLTATAGTLFVFINDIFSLRSWRYCVVVEWDLAAKSSWAALVSRNRKLNEKKKIQTPRPHSVSGSGTAAIQTSCFCRAKQNS